ncbi:putative Dol-P-Man:Man(7)GlcNAc(2)-PP-Dol alpha-1,6-mannosyltransferase [Paramyrothecium foliicola]|nr:putative Dol-P-Man:Man(7)GlcNAc(2)-PP-Dol alpha-1,6-mannosyltransferase [Paramyrothecium foliicola]
MARAVERRAARSRGAGSGLSALRTVYDAAEEEHVGRFGGAEAYEAFHYTNKDALLNSLLFLIPIVHLVVSPYTKVEESFSLQATHDILVYGTPVSNVHERLSGAYDHFVFPGAVPRTFVGPLALAGLARPLVALAGFRHAQLVVRAVLAAFNAGSLLVFRRALARASGVAASRWWLVLMMSQFHIPYYASRTLPNMFAFGLTTLAAAFLLPSSSNQKTKARRRQAIGLLVFSAAVFRSELAILLATTGLYLLATAQISLRSLVSVFLVTFLASLGISIPIDSYFWQKPLWPELWGFYYNAVLGSSSNWGVSPWHYYFTSALPRLLLNPLVPLLTLLAAVHPATSRRARDLMLPSLAFVAIYSLQPHKEARFIFYVVPSLTAAAALGADLIFARRSKSLVYAASSLVLAASVLAAFAGSCGMLLLSSLNYPGGDALSQLYALTRNDTSPQLSVHADVLTCMTGLTLFGQNLQGVPVALGLPPTNRDSTTPSILFDKTENDAILESPGFWKQFDYVLAENTSIVLGHWEVIGSVEGYSGIEILKPSSNVHKDVEAADTSGPVVGNGAIVAAIRDTIRKYTGGWWVGPRMSPRIHIMKQLR